uniref:Photosystem II 12 kDa extrinsic protein n=1 Tax=Minutocellus polymorphus TaxID=265543 RepID=A0A7S0AF01_9STRA|mmetsp:Transcript_12434/g.20682  ORF Transcript_12434/g.20682 Transcript_12434/m.20682 type:complete len:157 (+) Transcript_12434:91-561(+)
MKLSFILCLIPAIEAFAPLQKPVSTSTKLDATRRDVLLGIAAATAAAQPAFAKQAGIGSDWGFIDDEVVSAQQPTGDRVDVNNAAINEYMQFRGMYPSAAGKIASNGPYQSVKDIYKIPGLTENDKKVFKMYEKELTANKAQYRTFNERINSRVST